MDEFRFPARACASWVRPISRRKVLAAGAWSVPVLMVSAAMPFAAASGGIHLIGSDDIEIPTYGAPPITFDEVAAGDIVSPWLTVTVDNGGAVPSAATARLNEAAGVATWNEDAGEATGDQIVLTIDEGGTLTLSFVVEALGAFVVTLYIGDTVWNLTIVLSA